MARHRDIRNMDFEDEYDGYDDVYGHSVDEDYYISPSNRQFIYNRDLSRESRFEHPEDDIKEVDEVEELSDTDKAKLNSCIDQIKDTLGSTIVPRNELVNLVLKFKYNVEMVLNAILEDSKYEKSNAEAKEKDDTKYSQKKLTIPKSSFNIPKLNGFKQDLGNKVTFKATNVFGSKGQGLNLHSSNSNFTIPNIFGPKSNDSNTKTNNFLIPKLKAQQPDFHVLKIQFSPNETKPNDMEFNTLSELVSSHLKSTINKDYEVPESKDSSSELNQVFKKLTDIHISENIQETKPLASKDAGFEWDIDLSKALKTTGSLPSFSKNKENIPEKFEIPFIDCDVVNIIDKSKIQRNTLPCTLDIRDILKLNIKIVKKGSTFSKVIGRCYKNTRTKIIRHQEKNIISKFKRFTFNTGSPDDIIHSHLKK